MVKEMEGRKCKQETNDAMGDNEINGLEDEEQVTVTEDDDQRDEATIDSTQVRVIPSPRPTSCQEA